MYFYTNWCGHCQRFTPFFQSIVTNPKIDKNFTIAYINADEPKNRNLTQMFNIKSIPTVYILKNDKSKIILLNDLFYDQISEEDIVDNILNLVK